ncbi:MAG: hypothetical protein LBI90_04375, partial [Treponema sp.]|nr:hypothetical protein [Treponema sp.]
ALFGGCDNSTNPAQKQEPKVCECPNGTVHPVGTEMPCCEGEDCECTVELPPPVCECPENTAHEPGEKCCEGGEDCDCVTIQRYQITLPNSAGTTTVEDRTGKLQSVDLAKIENYFTVITPYSTIEPYVSILNGLNGTKVIIENTTSSDGFIKINLKEIAVKYEWLSAASDTDVINSLDPLLGDMYFAKVNIYDNGIRLTNRERKSAWRQI